MPPANFASLIIPYVGDLVARNVTTNVNAPPATISEYLQDQWRNPNDILSVLLLLGPEIVQTAIAQVAGRAITPVVFSFGWTAYAFKALLSTVGCKWRETTPPTPTHKRPMNQRLTETNLIFESDGKLMPEVAYGSTTVVGAVSGHSRVSTNWLLSKLLVDFDEKVDKEMRSEQAHPLPPPFKSRTYDSGKVAMSNVTTVARKPAWEALRVSVLQVDSESPLPHGVPTLDWVWLSGMAIIVIQIALSIIPWVLYGDWVIFMIIAAGNLFALVGASLPQWREEKWPCPRNGGSTVILTQGNGSRHATVILGKKGCGLDLEILARGTRTAKSSIYTRLITALLACLWVMLLITVAGVSQNTWCKSSLKQVPSQQ